VNSATSFAHNAFAAVFRAALVLALVASAWSIYRRLPPAASTPFDDAAPQNATALHIILRRPASRGKVPVQLYPINVAAARDEYASERRPGVRFEEFVTRLMGNRQPLSGELDERGETVIAVPPGRWWVHATLEGAEEITWRLPVNVSGREKRIELTTENAYTRAKSF
jgi:hypothetical protein